MPERTLLEHPVDRSLLVDPKNFRILAACSKCPENATGQKLSEYLPKAFSENSLKKLDEQLQTYGFVEWPKRSAQFKFVISILSQQDGQKWLVRCIPDNAFSYRAIFEENIAGIYQTTLEGMIMDCNLAMAHILDFESTEELIGRNVSEFYADVNRREAIVKAVLDSESVRNEEVQLISSEGRKVWVTINSFLDSTSGDKRITGTITDISDLKRAQDRYKGLFEKSTDSIVILNKDQIIDCNSKTEEIFGYEVLEIRGIRPFDFSKGLFRAGFNDVDMYLHKFELALKGEPQRAMMICHRKDGSSFHADVKLSPVHLEGETLVQQVIRDVSERVLYEDAIRESEERFRLLSKVAIESVVFVKDSVIIDCNDQMVSMIGSSSRDQLLGKKITDFVLRDDFERIRAILDLETINKSEVRCSTRSGETLVLETSCSHISYQGEQVIVMLFYDITARKRAEQALEQSSERFKNLVENSPNAVFILTSGKVKYANQSGVSLLSYEDEDELYNSDFLNFFAKKERARIESDLDEIRLGKDVDYRELKMLDRDQNPIDVGIKITLTVYDRQPSTQITVNNLSTRMLLLQEQVRAQLAEEINQILKNEIEEHKVTQRKLIETQNFTRNIIESSIDMIIAVDEELKVTEFNSAAQRKFGYKLEDIQGKHAEVLYGTKGEFEAVQKALNKDGSFTGEIINRTSDGEVFTSLLSASLIRTPEGEIVGLMGVSRDITEIKKAEQELIASEARYRDIFENASDFILSVDGKGNFKYANKSFRQTLGYSHKDLLTANIREWVEEGCIDPKKSLFDCFVSDKLNINFISKKGRVILTSGESSIRTKDGKNHSIRVILRDVTEARTREREVIEQKAKLEAIFDSTENMMIWTLDNDYKVTSSNSNFIKGMKQIRKKALKKADDFIEVLSNEVYEDLYQGQLNYFKRAFEGDAAQFELPLEGQDGSPVWLQVFLNPIYVNNKLEEISCLSYDITDRIEIDRKIRDSLREKEVLLQEVHHRVKNNLQVISSILNLQTSYVSDEGTLEILRESQNRIKSMSFVHEALYRNTDMSHIDFSEYIETITRSLIQSYSIQTLPVEFVQELGEVELSLDQAIPCGLIVNELVTNALKYAYEGIKQPQLRVRLLEKNNRLTVLVSDNGVGLPKDFQYEESDSLGIQLVYTLTNQLDGEIRVDNSKGTSFTISFDMT